MVIGLVFLGGRQRGGSALGSHLTSDLGSKPLENHIWALVRAPKVHKHTVLVVCAAATL